MHDSTSRRPNVLKISSVHPNREVAVTGIKQYIVEVKAGQLPHDEHSYTVNDIEYDKFAAMVAKRRKI